jgi:23S rRNA (pseudouridine1915-N3)-methyltransferase
MRLIVAAVGQKPPAWADAAYEEFERRFPPEMRLELKAVKAEPRAGGKAAAQLMQAEAKRLEAVLPAGARRVVLDEHGTRWTTRALADRLAFWRADGRDVAFVIGGPDGLDPVLKASADETARLSDLTLPHAFVRVLLAEALYRAWSLSTGHPYHRE